VKKSSAKAKKPLTLEFNARTLHRLYGARAISSLNHATKLKAPRPYRSPHASRAGAPNIRRWKAPDRTQGANRVDSVAIRRGGRHFGSQRLNFAQ
jgi:hypothetical protein